MAIVLHPSVEYTKPCESAKNSTIQSVKILKPIELCTLNGWILQYVNYISTKLFL